MGWVDSGKGSVRDKCGYPLLVETLTQVFRVYPFGILGRIHMLCHQLEGRGSGQMTDGSATHAINKNFETICMPERIKIVLKPKTYNTEPVEDSLKK